MEWQPFFQKTTKEDSRGIKVPISEGLIAGFLISFFLISYLCGRAIKILLSRFLEWRSDQGLFEEINSCIALFTVFIPFLGLLLSLIMRIFNTISCSLFIFICAVIVAYDVVKRKPIITLPSKKTLEYVPLLAILSFGIALRFLPLIGLHTYPADDPRVYAYLTKLVVDNKGFTFNLGPLSEYNQPILTYPYMVGFPAISSFFVSILGFKAPIVVTLISQMYSSLLILSIYHLGKSLFSRRAGLIAAAIISLVNPSPLHFFLWGGNADYVAYFLAPYVVLQFYNYLKNPKKGTFVFTGLLISGSLLYHPYIIVYVFPAITFILLKELFKSRTHKPFSTLLKPILSSALCLFPIIFFFFRNEFASNPDIFGQGSYEVNREMWKNVLFSRAYPFSWNLEYLQWLWGDAMGIFLISLTCSIYFLIKRKDKERILLPILWFFSLFLLYENGPYGLYFISFPFWGFIPPNRIALFFSSVPLTLIISYAIVQILKEASVHLKRPIFTKSRIIGFALLSVISFSAVLQVKSNYYSMFVYAREFCSPVSSKDVMAFEWIENYTNSTDIFWVNRADAGEWILVYTGRVVFPFRMLINKEEVVGDADSLDRLMYTNPYNVSTLAVLKKYNVSYVYFGERSAPLWENRSKPDVNLYLRHPDVYKIVYEDHNVFILRVDWRDVRKYVLSSNHIDEIDTKHIALYHNGDNVTLTGPVNIKLILQHNGDIAEEYSKTISAEECWAFQLSEWTPEHPGEWDAYIYLLSEGNTEDE